MKLNRIFKLSVQADGIKNQAGGLFDILPPMTIEFDVNRHQWSDQQTANIKIYNLNEDTRSKLFHDRYRQYDPTKKIGVEITGKNKAGDPVYYKNYPRIVELFAGYQSEGESLPLIFAGHLQYAHSTRRGPDIITELEDCFDPAINAYTQSTNLSLAANVDKKEVIKALFTELVGSQVSSQSYISPYFSGTAKRGQVFYGNTMKILRELTDNNVFFDLGVPHAALKGENIIDRVLILDSNSGILNVPVKSDTQITVQLIFTPEIQIGQLVEIRELESYNGVYQVLGLRHQGIISGTHDMPTTTTLSLYNGALMLPQPSGGV